MKTLILLIAVFANVFGWSISLASDGALEINHACVELGCFPGDGPGLPVEVRVPGKYILTSNIETSDPDATVLSIFSNNVRLDLNGFTLKGPNQCDLGSGSCSPGGSGRGINLVGGESAISGLHVVNGQVDGFGNYCMTVGASGFAADITASNCFAGLGVARGSVAERVKAVNNLFGIDMLAEAIIRNSSTIDNIINGIQINSSLRRGIIENCLIIGNGSHGIQAFSPTLITGNLISTNLNGIYFSGAAAGSSAIDNVIQGNENAGVLVNSLDGTAGISFSNNSLSSNGSEPFESQFIFDDPARIIELTPNLCHSSALCLE
ncbi:right-handed parallel beta-helix repeat-containing protein [Wenzhouxiangella limi]|uniref:Right-handed parallel beta-helix repeat-containing protein n=1 Tax=Wenzhouxiangella limi TaxID=2707351 RepID=A0A845UV33_9GAMM|nr:right-handed parallel beta-helix repeat-containing protein [Wenzhouxiangella limi]NDY94404.1 right-handed parallel beta-helix repeat-containing protein [Wenzhouxiangella limi]